MAVPFDPDRCTVPPIVRIGPAPLLGDGTVPEPPEEIIDCLATLTPFVDDLGCIPVTVRGGSEATFPVAPASQATGTLTVRIIPGPGCAYDFDLDLALPCLDLTGSGPAPVAPALYSSDSVGTVAVTVTPGPDCAYTLHGQAALPSPATLAITEPAGLTARTADGLGWGFATLYRLDRWTGTMVAIQTHVKLYNAQLAPIGGGALVPALLTDGALVVADAPTALCYTELTGKIIGGDTAQLPLAGSTVRVFGTVSGTDYGLFAATDGTYALTLALDSRDTAIDLVVTGPEPRFEEGPPVTVAVTACLPAELAPIQATPAFGYHYLGEIGVSVPVACQYPVRDTIAAFNELFGLLESTWTPAGGGFSGGWSSACRMLPSRATADCPSKTVPFTVTPVDGGYLGLNFAFADNPDHSGCPADERFGVPATCAGDNGMFFGFLGLTLVSITEVCPDAVTPYSCTLVYEVAEDHPWWPAGEQTFLIYED